MVECPVCSLEYIEGQIKFCSACGWDLKPYPQTFAGQIPTIFLEKEQSKITWAKNLWAHWQYQLKNSQLEQSALQVRLSEVKIQLQKVQQEYSELYQEYNGVNMSNTSTHGLWGTFESVLDRDYNSFKNPFEYDLWILIIEISHLSNDRADNTIRIEGKYNLYTNVITSFPTSVVKLGWINNQMRAEAGQRSGVFFGDYVFWRKDEDLRIESKAGNYIRITGQLIRCDYKP